MQSITTWDVLNKVAGLKLDFKPVPLSVYVNDEFSRMFMHEYTEFNTELKHRLSYNSYKCTKNGLPGNYGVDKWTNWVGDEYVTKELKNGIYTSKIGMPFLYPKTGNNVVFTSLWKNFPAKVNIAVGQKASKVYLLIAGSCMTMNYQVPNGFITVNYADKTKQEVALIPPKNYDSLLHEPFSKETCHVLTNAKTDAEITEIITNPEKVIESIELEVKTIETIIGLLGITLLS